MIKWPEKKDKKHIELGYGPMYEKMNGEINGWNSCLTACKQAELDGRMSKAEIRETVRPLFDRFSKGGLMMLRNQADELSDDISTAIHKALYGESETENTRAKD